jgi:hypothetical protein
MLLLRRKIGALGGAAFVRPWLSQLLLSVVAASAAYGLHLLGDWERGLTVKNVLVLSASIGAAVALYLGGAVMLKLDGIEQTLGKVMRRLRR